jgi:hypothetical protein
MMQERFWKPINLAISFVYQVQKIMYGGVMPIEKRFKTFVQRQPRKHHSAKPGFVEIK